MKYTLTEEGDKIVQRDLDKVIAVAKQYDVGSLVLFGAYGKGEGAIIDGNPRNDYDFLVIDVGDITHFSEAIHELDLQVKPELHIATSSQDILCTQQSFEIKYGSQVLYGDKLDLPDWQAYDIPFTDAINSLDRRIVSLLIGKHEIMKEAPDLRMATEQIIKAIIAVGDAILIRRGEFHHSYFVRALMLDADDIGELYQMAVAMKILGRPILNPDQVWSLWWSAKVTMRDFCMEVGIKPGYLDVLLGISDQTSKEELAEAVRTLGGGGWL